MDHLLEQRFAGLGAAVRAEPVDAALLVAELLDPRFDAAECRYALEALAARCDGREPWTALAGLGFCGNSDDYDALDNSHLGRVLETRRGIPISLAVLLIEVARQVGLIAGGVNFPGHFLVAAGEQLIDPFAMAPVRPEDCLVRLPEAERQRPLAELFAPASAQLIALRMLNNIKAQFASRAQWHRALEVADAQLAIAPGQAAVQLERGELWLRMGSPDSARHAFEAALALAESGAGPASAGPGLGPLADYLRRRIRELHGAGDVRH